MTLWQKAFKNIMVTGEKEKNAVNCNFLFFTTMSITHFITPSLWAKIFIDGWVQYCSKCLLNV